MRVNNKLRYIYEYKEIADYGIYDDQLQTWLSGNLRLQKITPRGGKYIATFSGKIVGWIN